MKKHDSRPMAVARMARTLSSTLGAAMSDLPELFRHVSTTAASEMDRALDCFYPVEGNNDLPESMAAHYLAFELQKCGFFIYPQTQCTGQIDNHLDFTAINPSSGVIVLAEAKKLYGSGQASSLGRDWRRLQQVRITSDFRQLSGDFRYFGCLIATAWKPTFWNWWAGPSRTNCPERQRTPEYWADLKHGLDSAVLNLALNIPLARLKWKQKLHVLFSYIPIQQQVLATAHDAPTIERCNLEP
jgi:hypothetical protein